jgi:hypothetical protein
MSLIYSDNNQVKVPSSNGTTKLNVLFEKILIDLKVLKNSTRNQASNFFLILTNQIEQLNSFLLNFTGKQKSFNGTVSNSRYKASSDIGCFSILSSTDNQFRIQNAEESDFIHRNNEVNLRFF